MEYAVGSISTGVTYPSQGTRFDFLLDVATEVYQHDHISTTVRRQVPPLMPELFPKAFVARTNGSGRAYAFFDESLSDDALKVALNVLVSRLIELGCLKRMPILPSPIRALG